MREICQSGSEGGEVLSLPDLISKGAGRLGCVEILDPGLRRDDSYIRTDDKAAGWAA
jgi:hypothetical protein